MKKFLALLLAMVTVLAMCSSASAAQITLRQYPMPAQVVKTVQLTDTCGLKQSKPSVLYVRHYLWSDVEGYYGSNNHTNYFQASPMIAQIHVMAVTGWRLAQRTMCAATVSMYLLLLNRTITA